MAFVRFYTQYLMYNVVQYAQDVESMIRCSQYVDAVHGILRWCTAIANSLANAWFMPTNVLLLYPGK